MTTEQVISGRYRLERRLGSGGMSTVYLATDTLLEREVAVKVLAEHLSDDENFVARFRREALSAAKLVHPNIVQVYDTGLDSGQHYIVMEYVEGTSLAQLLRTEPTLDAERVVQLGVQACAALDYAHRHGIIHRDVKPGNLMLLDRGGDGPPTVKLGDFGIARAAEQTRITQVGSVVGTAAYLSPEQAHGEAAGPASDIYALGVVLYQCLAGRLPFEGASLAELAIRQTSEQPLPPTEYNEDVPDELSWAVLCALEIDPQDRYESGRELAVALEQGLAGELDAATRVLSTTTAVRPAAATGTAHTAPVPAPAPAPPVPAGRSGPAQAGRLIGAVLALAVLTAGVALAVVFASDSERSVEVEQVVEDNVRDQIQGLEELIERNRR